MIMQNENDKLETRTEASGLVDNLVSRETEKATENSFQQGDKVKWSKAKATSRGISFTTQNGRVLSLEGELVNVRYRGKIIQIHRAELRLESEPSELTDLVRKLAG